MAGEDEQIQSTSGRVPRMAKLRDAAAECGVPYYQLRKLCNAGELVHRNFAGVIYLNMDYLADYLMGKV